MGHRTSVPPVRPERTMKLALTHSSYLSLVLGLPYPLVVGC